MYLVECNSAFLARGQASDCLMAVSVSRTRDNEGQQPLHNCRSQLGFPFKTDLGLSMLAPERLQLS